MTSDRHRRIKELFLAACELPEDARSPFLDGACGDDSRLRAEVESLLRFHDGQATGARDDGGVPAGAAAPPFPETLGPYRLIQKIGEGGMGEVYEAEQTAPVKRRVALKIIRWGMDTREVVARFETERQALALMDHPNIARVFEAGSTDQGRPFFAMEFVRGVPITDYCDTQRLTTDERLRLFGTVCEGVQHAHQRGVIHRDIKPSNILVAVQDGRPVPKIIDFGVAKATSQRLTERSVFTELGQWIGTPEYMSPEQAEMTGLDVDTRTDVYSLGVVLYELLVGAQPIDSTTLRDAGFDEMRRRIREDEPMRPSTRVSSLGENSGVAARRRRTDITSLVRELKGDLDWIVMKALEKDRTRRYATPLELADDVRRHLRYEPVEASPPSTAYRVRKFVRRHRVGVAAGSVVVLALVAGIVGTAVGLRRAQREAETAQQVVRFISGIFRGMNPGDSAYRAASIREVLAQGADRVDTQLGGQPLVAAELKTIIAQVYMGLGEFTAARPLLEESLTIREQIVGPDDPGVADSVRLLANQMVTAGEFPDSRPLFERALAIYQQAFGPESEQVGVTADALCYTWWRLGDFDRAMEFCDRSLEILEKHHADHAVYADTLYHKMIVLREMGELEAAVAAGERALAIRRQRLGPDHVAVGWTLFDLGICLRLQGEREAGRELVEQALAIHERALGPENTAVSFDLCELGVYFYSIGDYDEAKRLLERAIAIRERALGKDHPDLQWALRPYAGVVRALGNRDRAVELYARALELVERTYGPDHPEAAAILGSIGYTVYRTDLTRARGLFERALAIRQKAYGADHKRVGINYYDLGCIHALEGDRESALEMLRRAFGCGWWWEGIEDDPDLDGLRGDPEFETVLDQGRANATSQ